MSGTVRPEDQLPPEFYYDDLHARNYDRSTRIVHIQNEISNRCIELLGLSDDGPSYLLDIGCGSGLSGQVLTDLGHFWIGIDISRDMLNIGVSRESSSSGDLIQQDMGRGLPFRPSTFDGAISVSALQWLCYANTSEEDPHARIMTFYSSLHSVLKKSAKAVFQFYPANDDQTLLLLSLATRSGLAGALVVDFPDTPRRKKLYLVLSPSSAEISTISGGAQEEGDEERRVRRRKKPRVKSREWIIQKKDHQRMIQAYDNIHPDSKYTGRSRRRWN